MNRYLFLVASARDVASDSNTERLARIAATHLPADSAQTWLHLCGMRLEAFTDRRHSSGTYAYPTGDLARLLEATLACTNLVLVAPVYWYSFPAALKACLDHWTGWLRVPDLNFRQAMSAKTLHLVTTAADKAKAQPMIDTARMCAGFFPMHFAGALVGHGGAPGAIDADRVALDEAARFFGSAAGPQPGAGR